MFVDHNVMLCIKQYDTVQSVTGRVMQWCCGYANAFVVDTFVI